MLAFLGNIVYTIIVKGRSRITFHGYKKEKVKILKFPLTSITECDTIQLSRGESKRKKLNSAQFSRHSRKKLKKSSKTP